MRLVISDSSPLYALYNIELLQRLQGMDFEIHVPSAVWRELTQPESTRVPIPVPTLHFLIVHQVEAHRELEMLEAILDKGESEASILAEQLNADSILIDETRGRAEAERRGLRVIGLVGILKIMKRAGNIPKVRPYLLKLRDEYNFWISQKLIDSADQP